MKTNHFWTVVVSLFIVVILLFFLPLISALATNAQIESLTSKLNGLGYIAYANAGTGDWIVTGDILPTVNNTQDIGENATRWQSGYFGTSVISPSFVGDVTGSISGGTVAGTSVTTDSLDAPTGRTATLVVAASDAPTLVKNQADYVCDGTADEVQINAAIQALPNVGMNQYGGKVRLVGNNFYTSATIAMNILNTILEGDGRESTRIFAANGTTHDIITITANHNWVTNLKVDGNYTNRASGRGAYIYQASFVNLVNVHFQWNRGYSIEVAGTVGTEVVSFKTFNVIAGNPVTSGLRLGDYVSDTLLINSNFAGSSVSGSSTAVAIVNPLGLWIDKCYFDQPTGGAHISISRNNTNATHYGTVKITDNHFLAPTSAGIYASVDSDNEALKSFIITGNTFWAIGADAISLAASGTGRVMEDWTIADNNFYSSGARHIRAIGTPSNYLDFIVADNTFENDTSGVFYTNTTGVGSQILWDNNTGYIGTGEIRTISKPLTAGAQNTVTSIQNLFKNDVMITEDYVRIGTAATGGNPTYDMGTDDDGAGAPSVGNNLFEAIPDTAGYYRATSAGLGGDASGKLVQPILWQATGNDWVNFIITDDTGTGLVGTFYITVMGL